MSQDLIATASITINAPTAIVWQALVDPQAIKAYMFGATVVSDWHEGRPIVWKGEWQGKPYEDKGAILQIQPEHRLKYSHYSPLSGLPDEPGNYHTVTIELTGQGNQTLVRLTQDHNASEEDRQHSARNWEMMLGALKKYVEQ